MKYLINKTNHCDFKTIAVNRLEPRAYFIAHSTRLKAYETDYFQANGILNITRKSLNFLKN